MSIDLNWFKSSYSDDQGGACVEVAPCPHPWSQVGRFARRFRCALAILGQLK
ncbi:DUF397 domain-containing protein [Streptomyces sp. NPDC101160]|uniref:DUF397 domain-containing protein n=1 Tax=Streptomyces sp. NPDC101160 TaxID=3366118 RepID=UPI003813FB94